MHLERLTQTESRIVGEVLRAAADGPFFPDWEFHTLFGLERQEVREIADRWPLPIVDPQVVTVAVNNSFNNLLGYPHGMDDVWSKWISVDRTALNELFNRVRERREEGQMGRTPTGSCPPGATLTSILTECAEAIGSFDDGRRRRFYETLAHNLTVCARAIWSDEQLSDAAKVEQMKWLNEIQHRVTGKLRATAPWLDAEFFEGVLRAHTDECPPLRGHIGWAIKQSYEYASGAELRE